VRTEARMPSASSPRVITWAARTQSDQPATESTSKRHGRPSGCRRMPSAPRRQPASSSRALARAVSKRTQSPLAMAVESRHAA
jgi:hypothetical protein